ncbi:ribonuclease M5 [Mesoplasma whartonense]|uniref:ribonuclease M5 n=1 Tax=Mesoplasma whartonense TaxID=2878854 RepID=UPI002022AB9A|nr:MULTISPECIES: ribonuclease M5 [unclassified Mesoplasma]MCL8212786.1 Ribonuclease M5 [Mesoplasma sp. JKS002661]MCL8213521.1 Ribonuclease M5 [Mesoplasma sp. JKS002660]MCL8215787.1 Ribonuclease M5 [Mesoplasma sp. JKS002657]
METSEIKGFQPAVVVVEGKTDSAKLKKIYGETIKVLETSGMGINREIINQIKTLGIDHQIIVFTDPDTPGKKIREIINQALEGEVYNAFIEKKDILKPGKIGIAEASDEAIIKAMGNLIIFDQHQSLTWKEYLDSGFFQPLIRKQICAYYHFDQLNNKTLFKWLNWMNLSAQEIQQILEESE